MISLDEEMVGQDAGTLIIRAIKVCAGVACQLADGRVAGPTSVQPARHRR